jgi:RNA polymerase sigma-70 factor (ECF subfamily)
LYPEHVLTDPAPRSASSDATLVEVIIDGRDRAAAEADLCARYGRRVYLYGLRHLRDAVAAEDFMQDVLTTVIERVRGGAVHQPDKLGSFVLGMCRLQAIGRKRGEARRARILALYGDQREGEQDLPEGLRVDSLDLSRVRDCLSRLADRDRTVLLLTFYAELDAAALGREIGVEPSHVRVLRHRAMGRLQSCVKGTKGDDT